MSLYFSDMIIIIYYTSFIQKAMKLEDVNEVELNEMREELTKCVLENKHFQATMASQKELSKLAYVVGICSNREYRF